MPADRCACRKVALRGDVDVVVAGSTSHARELCCPDLMNEFCEAAVDVVGRWRADGCLVKDGKPFHPPGCGCGPCSLVVALVRAEGGGRCAVCGCTDDDACDGGCRWTSTARVCCDAHDIETIIAAEKLFAGDKRRRAA